MSVKWNLSLVWFGVSCCFVFSSSSLFGEDLPNAVKLGLNKSPAVKKAIAEATSAFFETKEVKSDRRPQLFVESSGGRAFRDRSIDGVQTGTGETLTSRDARISLQQLLFDFGASKALVKSAQYRNQFKEMLVEDMREEQALKICETYVNVYRSRCQINSINEQIRYLNQYLATARQDLNVSDQETLPQILIIESRVESAKGLLAMHQGRLNIMKARFKMLTTLNPDGKMKMCRVPTNLATCVNYLQSPRVKAADLAIRSSEQNMFAAQRDRLPKIYFEGRTGWGVNVLGIDGGDDEWSTLAVARWPIMEGGRKMATINKQGAEIDKDMAAKQEVIDSIKESVESAQFQLNSSLKRRQSAEAAKNKLVAALAEFDREKEVKQVGVLNLVNARSELLTANITSTDALFDQYLAAFSGLESSGGLLRYLGIEAPEVAPTASAQPVGP